MNNFKLISTWDNKERCKVYQLREYKTGREVYVYLGCGWFKSGDIVEADLVASKEWKDVSEDLK